MEVRYRLHTPAGLNPRQQAPVSLAGVTNAPQYTTVKAAPMHVIQPLWEAEVCVHSFVISALEDE